MYTFIKRICRRRLRFIRFLLGKELIHRRQLRIPIEYHGNWVIASKIIDKQSIVYSIGVGNEITFDLSLIQRYGVTVHAFDPTPRSIAWIKEQILPDRFLHHPIGIASYDGTALFHPPLNPDFVSYTLINGEFMRSASDIEKQSVEAPVRRLVSIMNELRHKKIDLLKMDVEGAEYEVIQDLISESLPVCQILVEFHHRLTSIGAQRTWDAIRSLNQVGYRIFYVSDSGEEYSFIKISVEKPK